MAGIVQGHGLLSLAYCFLWFSHLAYSAVPPPLWEGMPETLPMDYLEQNQFLPFHQELVHEDGSRVSRAPLGAEFYFNGVPVSGGDQNSLGKVFQESFLARIEKGTRIQTRKDAQGKSVWEYPIGAASAHLISFKDQGNQARIFELRLVVKLAQDQWAFAAYSPSYEAPGEGLGIRPVLKLHQYAGLKPESFVALTRLGERIQVSMKRIKLSSCRACHLTDSPARHQYRVVDPTGRLDRPASLQKTGPCGFVPGNPGVQPWIERYLSVYPGESPFQLEH